MTRKHFLLIAEAIRTAIASKAQREAIARELVPALRAANSGFDPERFLEACIGQIKSE